MANLTPDQLPNADSLQGSDRLIVQQTGTSKTTLDDIKTFVGAASSADGIISGLGLFVSGLNLAVDPGSWRISGIMYSTSTETDITLAAADPTDNRIDLIYGDAFNRIRVVTGVATPNPVKPNLPSNTVELGFVLVTPTGSTTQSPPPADYLTTAQFMSDFGDKTQLTTNDKNSGVEAINEVKAQLNQLSQDQVILTIIKKSNYK